MIRLQKYLADAGICSRRKGEVLISSGRVAVNGETVTLLGTRVDPSKDRVTVDKKAVRSKSDLLYILLNKPKGVISSCQHKNEKTVLDLIDLDERIYPVGRLDKDSTGLILLTNDGPLHNLLSHPSFNHEKEYLVTVKTPIYEKALEKLSRGVVIEGRKTRPAKIIPISSYRFTIILKEGRNRQIRRMVQKVGNEVTQLKRVRFSNLTLGKLLPGQWRHLSEKEKNGLLKNKCRKK